MARKKIDARWDAWTGHVDAAQEIQKDVKLYVVLIEWDGAQPPTTWYKRMHRLAGRVRGEDALSVVERRADQGVIFQEGCILCKSESLAKVLAVYARDWFHASAVSIGVATVTTNWGMSAADAAIIDRVQTALGKRGRKPPEADYVITCHEEMKVYADTCSRPIQCPGCAGMRIHVRQGHVHKYRDDGQGPAHDLWLRTRFTGAHWEPCAVDGETTPPDVDDLELLSAKDSAIAGDMTSDALAAALASMPRAHALEVLDAIYVARRHTAADKRGAARLAAVTEYMMMGGDAAGLLLIEQDDEPDLLDAAHALGAQVAAALMVDFWNGGD
jgi:hypothetical protein